VSFRPYNPSYAARLGDFATVFNQSRRSFRDLATDAEWRPAPASPAERDAESLAQRVPPLPSTAPLLIGHITYQYLFAASEHLGALGVLYAAHDVTIAPSVIQRAALEHSARALWVVNQAGGDPEDRLARGYLEEFVSAEEAKKTAGRMLGKQHHGYLGVAADFKRIRQEAEEVFAGPVLDSHGHPEIRGQRLPGLEDCILWALRFCRLPSEGIYDFLSSASHPTLYMLRDLWAIDDSGSQRRLVSDVRLEDHEKRVRLVVIPFFLVLGYVADFNGWSRTRLDELADAVNRVIPGAITDLPQSADRSGG
jgi:hypothetical protein